MFKKIKKLCVAILVVAIAVSFFSCTNESDSGNNSGNGGDSGNGGNTVLQNITVTIGAYNDLFVTQTTEGTVVTLTADAPAKWHVNRVLKKQNTNMFAFDTAGKTSGVVYDILAVDSEGRSAQVEIKVE